MINFIKLRLPAIILSLLVILTGLWFIFGPKTANLGVFTPQGFNYSIDFQGGLVLQVVIYTGINQDELRSMTIKSGLGSDIQKVIISEKQRIGNESAYLIKTIINEEAKKMLAEDPNLTPAKLLNDRIEALFTMIKEKYGETYSVQGEELKRANTNYPEQIPGEILADKTPDKRVVNNVVKLSDSVISPVYSESLRMQAIFLILFTLIIIQLYISFRFKFKYAIGAVLALMHDVLVMVGFVAVNRFEVDYTIIAAILFIIGYSINDTIVIYDRIRETFTIIKDKSSKEIINLAINQTLSRSIITSMTVFIAALALAVFGGTKLYSFSVTILVGIISGTYSSIFIAAPIVDSWDDLISKKKYLIKPDEKKMIKSTQFNNNDSIKDANDDKSLSSTSTVLSRKQLKKISGVKKKK